MWLETLFEKLTCFFPRPFIVQPNEGGFRQIPKPWTGWPWAYWPWIRWEWLGSKKDWPSEIKNCGGSYRIYCPVLPEGKPWSDKDNDDNTWVSEMKPGNWYWIVPLVMEHSVINIKVQPKDIRIQSVWTKDGHDLAIGGAIRYYVQKPIKAILEVHDYDLSLQIIALAVIREFVGQHTLAELRENIDEVEKKLLTAVREGSSGWGLWIQGVDITDIGKTRNIRLLTSGSGIVGADT